MFDTLYFERRSRVTPASLCGKDGKECQDKGSVEIEVMGLSGLERPRGGNLEVHEMGRKLLMNLRSGL